MSSSTASSSAAPGGAAPRLRTSPSAAVAYDFRRPIQLSRELQRVLQVSLDDFARRATTVFTSSLRRICQVTLVDIDQRSYAEYVDAIEGSSYLTLFGLDPVPGRGLLEVPLGSVMRCVDHMLGGPGDDEQPLRPLTEIEGEVIGGLVGRLIDEMYACLGPIVAIESEITGVEYNPQLAQVAAGSDVMVVAALELRIEDHLQRMTVCLPFVGLHPHLTTAAAPESLSPGERRLHARASAMLTRSLDDVPVEISVRFRSLRMTPDVLGELTVGSLLTLSHPSSAPLDVTVHDQAFAQATAGTHGTRLAALVVASSSSDPANPSSQELS